MDSNTLILWGKSLELLRPRLPGLVPETQAAGAWSWFEALQVREQRGKTLIIGCPTNEFIRIFQERYQHFLMPCLQTCFGADVALQYVVVEPSKESANDASKKRTSAKAEPQKPAPLDPQLNKDYTFANFVKGKSNKAALNIAKAIAEKPTQPTFNPLFLYGPSGVGKTHLVTAIGHRVKELYPDRRVLFVSASLFKTQYMDATKNNVLPEFMHFYQSIDLLIVDDIQEFTTAATQRTFFHIFNHLQLNGRQIVITCDRPPVLFEGIEERMLTRFKWGMVMEMERPDLVLRHDFLKAHMRRHGIEFPREVTAYIAEHVTSNVRDLQGVVNSIMAYSIADECEIDTALAERIVARVVNLSSKEITLQTIMRTICRFYNVKTRDIVSKSRKADIVAVRQLIMYLADKHTNINRVQIGQEIGRRDHSTVLYAIKHIEKRLSTDRDYRLQIEALEASLSQT